MGRPRGAGLMTDEELTKGNQLSKETWRDAVRLIAPAHGVDANELLMKAPSFPVNPTDPGQLQAYFAEVQLKADELSVAELTVCMLAYKAVVEVLWQSIKNRHPDLPGFRA